MAPSNASGPQDPSWLKHVVFPPPLHVPSALAAWQAQQEEIRARLCSLLGRLPPRPASPKARVIIRETRADCVVERVEIDNGAGEVLPGYLLLPRSVRPPFPAVLYCHWHGDQYQIGKEELWQTNAVPEPPGPALVRRGFAVLAVDAPGFGERQGRGPGGPRETGAAEEMSLAKLNLWLGRSLWGMMLRDDLVALDYLCARPEIDTEHVGATGISMGATRTWWLMALDGRLRAGVAVACLTHYQSLIRRGTLSAHGIYYYVPGMLTHFDTDAVVALAAPRALLVMNGDQDPGSPVEGIRHITGLVSQVYRLWGCPEHFQSRIFPGVGHVYLPEMWSATLDWLTRHLRA